MTSTAETMSSETLLSEALADGAGLSAQAWLWICVFPFVIGFIGSEFAP